VKAGGSVYTGYDDRPIFIGACPRSGTTLLRSMLNTHPSVAIPRETRFLPAVWENRARWRDLDDTETRSRLAMLITDLSWTRADRLDTPIDELVKRLMAAPPTLGSILGTCFESYAQATGKRRWGDKRPMYARYLDGVFSLFPDAQFVNVIRDPRASVASMRKLNWFGGAIGPGLDLWERSVRAVDPWRDVLHSDQFTDVRYEDLVADPTTLLTGLAQFLGLSADSVPVMLTFHEHVDETVTRYHSRLSEPISTDSVRAWEDTLDPDEIALIEHVTGRWMDRFGYDRVAHGRRPSPEILTSYDTCRRDIAYQRFKIEIEELKRVVIYRQDVSARLTSGQLDHPGRIAMPRFRQRHLGKPR
jgi:Sulfotransferase family